MTSLMSLMSSHDYLHLVNCPEVVIISDILCNMKVVSQQPVFTECMPMSLNAWKEMKRSNLEGPSEMSPPPEYVMMDVH